MTIDELTAIAPVIPVVVLDDADDAIPLARALTKGGLPVIEVTLRTREALTAIERIANEVEQAVVGAGTITSSADAQRAIQAGAQFLVSPGTTPTLLEALEATATPFLPGISTASGVIALLEHDIRIAKLFPAQACGGIAAVKAFAGPFPTMRFCPTGGIDQQSAPQYLALPNVCCIGGSWMLPADAVKAKDWTRIEQLARAAAELGQRSFQVAPEVLDVL